MMGWVLSSQPRWGSLGWDQRGSCRGVPSVWDPLEGFHQRGPIGRRPPSDRDPIRRVPLEQFCHKGFHWRGSHQPPQPALEGPQPTQAHGRTELQAPRQLPAHNGMGVPVPISPTVPSSARVGDRGRQPSPPVPIRQHWGRRGHCQRPSPFIRPSPQGSRTSHGSAGMRDSSSALPPSCAPIPLPSALPLHLPPPPPPRPPGSPRLRVAPAAPCVADCCLISLEGKLN